MRDSLNPSRFVLSLNVLALAVITGILAAAFAEQLLLNEPPCPLCLLQRAGLIAAGLGFLLNLRFDLSPVHYGIALLGSLAGAATALRQILLHIAPGDAGFGLPFAGLHLYTWCFIAFVCLIVGIGGLLILHPKKPDHRPLRRGWFTLLIMVCFVGIVLANLASTLLECGWTQCPDNPVSYLWLDLINAPR